MKTTPPEKPQAIDIFKQVIEARKNEDHAEPHVIFIPHNLSRMMKEQLDSEGITIHQFITRVCIDHLKLKDKEKEDIQKYLNFSDMQLFEFVDGKVVSKY